MKKTTLTLSLTAALFTLSGCFTPEDSILDWTASEARDKCHERVADKLKSPSTAEFEDDSEYTTEKEMDGTVWRIRGHVDSQNDFGGTVRSEWSCALQPREDDSPIVSVRVR